MGLLAQGSVILAVQIEASKVFGLNLGDLTTVDFMALQAGVVGLIVLSLFATKTNRVGVNQPVVARAADAQSRPKKALFGSSAFGPGEKAAAGDDYARKVEARMKAREQLHQQPVIVSSRGLTRDLNVFFNWNGHSWDAFEVLGLPAGARGEQVLSQFRKLKAERPDAEPFLQAAVDAILKRV